MKTALVAFILSALCGAVLTPLVRALAVRLGALDHSLSQRKIHGRPVARLGGIAIVGAFYAPLVALLVYEVGIGRLFYGDRRLAAGLFIGGIAIAALGVWDDLRGTNAWTKFTVQFAVAGLMYAMGFHVDRIANPFGPEIVLGWLAVPFTLLWIVGVINAMNLVDGLDGLAGGVALVAIATTFVVAVLNEAPLMMLFCASLGGAILGFLFYNFNPASIFMGDSGSMFLGFVLAVSAIRTNQKSATTVAILIPLTALGLPILDTLLAVMRRAVNGRPLFQADREHIHHRLLAIGLSHRQAVLVLYGICILFAAAALVLTVANSGITTLVLVGLGVSAFLFLSRLGYLRSRQAARAGTEPPGAREMRAAIREAGERLRESGGLEDVRDRIGEAAPRIGAACWRLSLAGGAGENWSHGFEEQAPGAFVATFVLAGRRDDLGKLELGFRDGRLRLDHETEVAAELLCEHVALALDRLRGGAVQEARGAAR